MIFGSAEGFVFLSSFWKQLYATTFAPRLFFRNAPNIAETAMFARYSSIPFGWVQNRIESSTEHWERISSWGYFPQFPAVLTTGNTRKIRKNTPNFERFVLGAPLGFRCDSGLIWKELTNVLWRMLFFENSSVLQSLRLGCFSEMCENSRNWHFHKTGTQNLPPIQNSSIFWKHIEMWFYWSNNHVNTSPEH